MSFRHISAGDNPPESINVVIEIPRGSNVKYELDISTGAIFVEGFLYTATHYPFNYGFIPETKSTDGDPLDAIVLSQEPVFPMTVIRSRPIGVLLTEDEKGSDSKIVAVPDFGIDPFYSKISTQNEIPKFTRGQIEHFFLHYKETEPNKFAKVKGWGNTDERKKLIREAIEAYRGSQ